MNSGRHPSSLTPLVVLVGALSGASAGAQILVDPTRPPTPVVTQSPESATSGIQLQSVMISPTRRSAIINGVTVELGGKYGDAVLMRVAEDQVLLKSGTSQQVLRLHPAVEKVGPKPIEPVVPAAEKSAPPKAKAKAKPKAKVKAKPKAKSKG
jgi:MSHA biogenesis protein MshK